MSNDSFMPYGRQCIDKDDELAVLAALRSDYLTTGPRVGEFEQAIAEYVDSKHGVAVSSGTAALHASMFALGIGPGDEVIVPPITFAATANCVVYQGGTPVFADVEPDTLLIDPAEVEKKISPKTKAIIGVDFAGHPCDWDALRGIASKHGAALIADGCHALGAQYKGRPVGSLADMTVFSFHAVKHIATGEGGMVVTDGQQFAEKMRMFRNHGIAADSRKREELGSWFYEMTELGFNYRLTDVQCALGLSQFKKLDSFLRRRRELAAQYTKAIENSSAARPLLIRNDVNHAFHLYVIRVDSDIRENLFSMMRQKNIGVNVHYIPVHLHPYYRRMGCRKGMCPVAEKMYEQIISLPMHPGLSDSDIDWVVQAFFEN